MPRIRATSIDEHKELTRRAILGAAEDLIGQSGSADISLGDLTASAGIGRTTFYEYFADRDDVIASLVEEELPGVIAELIDSVDHYSIEERLGDLIVATIEFVVARPVLGLILHTAAPRLGPTAQERIRVAHSGLSGEMASVYVTGVNEGVFVSLDSRLAGRLIQDSIMAGAKSVIESPEPLVAVESVAASVRQFLLAGLRLNSGAG